MVDKSEWVRITEADPNHSSWYIERFRTMAAQGRDLDGEARLVHAMAPRGGRILDAGCGPGRVAGRLAALGHEVIGVDVDAELIAAAEQDHPGPTYLVGDLAELDLAASGVDGDVDVVVCAGNVMTFLAVSTRRLVLARMAAHLRPGGRIAVGFGTDRGYDLEEFRADVADVGLTVDVALSTWDLRPLTDDSAFVVAILAPTA